MSRPVWLNTPPHSYSEQGHLDVVKYLVIELQIDPLYEDAYGNTALHQACSGGCLPVVELLTAELRKYYPSNVINDFANKWHSTPLLVAVTDCFNSYSRYLHLCSRKYFLCPESRRGPWQLREKSASHVGSTSFRLAIVFLAAFSTYCRPEIETWLGWTVISGRWANDCIND